jgi:hypothetical protein
LPENVDSREEDSFRQQIRDMAFTVLALPDLFLLYQTNSPPFTGGIDVYQLEI